LDKLLLTVAVLPIAAAIGGFYYFEDYPQWMRVIAILAAVGISGMIALQTALGQTAWAFRRDAIIEVRKVVWPTRKETTQTTMIVLVVVIIMSLLLWALDSVLAWVVRTVTT
jgi:preprotein translocase subunit SecE